MKFGINYDTGVYPGGRQSRPVFQPEQVAFDIGAIAHELGCAAVRVTGGDLEKLTVAANYAADAGLEVWFSPFPCELDPEEMLAFFEESAERAEALRQRSVRNVVLVTGCELSVFGRGFLPGADAYARMSQLSRPSPELYGEYPKIVTRLKDFLAKAAGAARRRFAGPLTYASGPWEPIDWTPFDIVGVDAYRDENNASQLDRQIEALSMCGKPVAVTEFGCCTYRGAGERGASGWTIVEGAGQEQQLARDCERDEGEQVRYLRDLVETYERHNIDAAFWFTFASWNRPHHTEARRDLDLASFGLVKVIDPQAAVPQKCWKPKAVFGEFARITHDHARRDPQRGRSFPGQG